MIGNIDKKVLLDLTVLFTKDLSPKLATKTTLSVLDKFERNISGQAAISNKQQASNKRNGSCKIKKSGYLIHYK